MGRLNQPQLKGVGQEVENWEEGQSKLFPEEELMSGPVVIELSVFSLNEHRSRLATRPVWGRADVSLPEFSGTVLILVS